MARTLPPNCSNISGYGGWRDSTSVAVYDCYDWVALSPSPRESDMLGGIDLDHRELDLRAAVSIATGTITMSASNFPANATSWQLVYKPQDGTWYCSPGTEVWKGVPYALPTQEIAGVPLTGTFYIRLTVDLGYDDSDKGRYDVRDYRPYGPLTFVPGRTYQWNFGLEGFV